MKRQYYIILTLIFFITLPSALLGQEQTKEGILMEYTIENGDTVYICTLPPAYSFPKPPKGKAGKSLREFYRDVHNFSKAYPYALIAKDIISESDKHIKENNLSGKEREKYLEEVQDKLFKEFEKPLRNLTFTQGRMLMRLIDREIGLSSYQLIKELRGGIAAGLWQGVARIFGANLKTPYDKFGEDKILEELIGYYQKGEFPYVYYAIFGKYPEPIKRDEPS